MKRILKKFNLIPNSSVLPKYLCYGVENVYWFNHKLETLNKENYIITSMIVDKEGVFKLTAKLKPALLTQCVLKEKDIDKNEGMKFCYKFKYSPTYPTYCQYYQKGICSCANHNACLYQKTRKHEIILKKMVNIYKKKSTENKDYTHSYFYEDTEYGRIFSKANEGLNDMKPTNRLYGEE